MALDHGVSAGIPEAANSGLAGVVDQTQNPSCENKAKRAQALREALRPGTVAGAQTNRERYVGAARVMHLYSAFMQFSGNAATPALLAQAEALAKAQAWDAYIEHRGGSFKKLRGVPGGLFPLGVLERASRAFRRWLDEPCEEGEGKR